MGCDPSRCGRAPVVGRYRSLDRRLRLMDLTAIGVRRTLGAIRQQNVPVVLLGAALVAIGLARRLDRTDREPVYTQKLKPGESVRVMLATPDGD